MENDLMKRLADLAQANDMDKDVEAKLKQAAERQQAREARGTRPRAESQAIIDSFIDALKDGK